MKIWALRLAMMLGLLLSTQSAWSACTLSPSDMDKEIKKNGIKATVRELESDGQKQWYALMDCIATGEKPWIQIAVSLGPQDASAGEDLNIYLGEALSNNAENVLRIAVPVFDLDSVCGALDNDAHPQDWYLKNLDSQETGLDKIKSVDLATTVTDCRESIERVRKYVQSNN